jgi:hypothetical protein
VVAVADVIRGEKDGEAAPESAVPELRAAGITGVLVYTDRDCVLHAVRLPDLSPAELPAGPDVGCEFELSPDGTHVEPPGAAWYPEGFGYALCRGNVVDVVLSPSPRRPRPQVDGCAPAWRPGSPAQLTVADQGAIEQVVPDCNGRPPCEEVVISTEALLEAAGRHPNASSLSPPAAIDVQDVEWLSPDEAVVLLRLRLRFGPQDLVARFQNGRLRETHAFRDDEATSLERSSGGHFLLVEPGRLGLHVAGSTVDVRTAVGTARAGAWSPDERWLALARPGRVAFVETQGFGGSLGRIVEAPIDARDLAWVERTPQQAAPPDDELQAAAAPLREEGVTGTIVYTDLSCELRALRLPDLFPLEPPRGPPVGCEFELSPDGERVSPRDAAWSGGHAAYALCSGDTVLVYWPPSGRPQAGFEGCTPAWRPRPPFMLTLVRSAMVVELPEGCPGGPPCERRLITRRALREAAERHPNVTGQRFVQGIDIQDLAWLSAARAVALLRVHIVSVGPQDLIAIFDGGEVSATYSFFDDELERLEVSPDGTSVASEPEVFAFVVAGPRIDVPDAFGPIAGVAWSPDGRRLALAADGAIVIVAPGERELRIPVTAQDLAWR